MRERGRVPVLLASVLLVTSLAACGPRFTTAQRADIAFRRGEVQKAEEILKEGEEKIKDKDYPLILLSQGSTQLALGDYQRAISLLTAAVDNLEVALNAAGVGVQILRSESGRMYRGHPHEKVLAHTYMGFAYHQLGQYTDARIEFAKALEADKGKKEEYKGDVAISSFLDGFSALRWGEYHHARVSFRKVNELKPEFPFGWYALSRACSLDGDEQEAEEAWERYAALVGESERFARDGSSTFAIFVIDAGWGPLRKPDPFIGQFAQWKHSAFPERSISLSLMNGQQVDAYPVEDMHHQAMTAGGFGDEVKKKIVSVAAKQALRQIPCVGLFVGKSEADIRAWNMSPGQIYIAAVPIPAEPTSVRITAYSKKGARVPGYSQVDHYIVGRTLTEARLVYARSVINADYYEIEM